MSKVHLLYSDNSWAPSWVRILCRSDVLKSSKVEVVESLKEFKALGDKACKRCLKKLEARGEL